MEQGVDTAKLDTTDPLPRVKLSPQLLGNVPFQWAKSSTDSSDATVQTNVNVIGDE